MCDVNELNRRVLKIYESQEVSFEYSGEDKGENSD